MPDEVCRDGGPAFTQELLKMVLGCNEVGTKFNPPFHPAFYFAAGGVARVVKEKLTKTRPRNFEFECQ